MKNQDNLEKNFNALVEHTVIMMVSVVCAMMVVVTGLGLILALAKNFMP